MKVRLRRISAAFLAIMMLLILTACGAGKNSSKIKLTMYLWDKPMMKELTPWLEAQFPDIDFTFVVGYNTMDFYTDLAQRDKLPDIITCRRFSLNDAAHLSDLLMDLSETNVAGSFYDSYIENYREPEGRVIQELKNIGKPFVVLLNCVNPDSETAVQIAEELSAKYDVCCLRVNCQTLSESDIISILQCVLKEFPIQTIGVFLPEWLTALTEDTPLKKALYESLREAFEKTYRIKESSQAIEKLSEKEAISQVRFLENDLGNGNLNVEIQLPRALYYQTISEKTGLEIQNDGDLIALLSDMSKIKTDYEHLREALLSVRETGYGVVLPDPDEMTLEEPQIVRQGGKYTVKLKANAPVLHMFMTDVETEVSPAIGGETASEDIINFLLQGFDGDVNRIWESNIFGKSLNDIAEEGLTAKIQALPENARRKLRITLQRVINEGSGGLICIIL